MLFLLILCSPVDVTTTKNPAMRRDQADALRRQRQRRRARREVQRLRQAVASLPFVDLEEDLKRKGVHTNRFFEREDLEIALVKCSLPPDVKKVLLEENGQYFNQTSQSPKARSDPISPRRHLSQHYHHDGKGDEMTKGKDQGALSTKAFSLENVDVSSGQPDAEMRQDGQ